MLNVSDVSVNETLLSPLLMFSLSESMLCPRAALSSFGMYVPVKNALVLLTAELLGAVVSFRM